MVVVMGNYYKKYYKKIKKKKKKKKKVKSCIPNTVGTYKTHKKIYKEKKYEPPTVGKRR